MSDRPIYDAVRAAPNIQEAMLALAAGIDEVLRQHRDTAASSWGDWTPNAWGDLTPNAYPAPAPAGRAAVPAAPAPAPWAEAPSGHAAPDRVEALAAALDAAKDPQEIRALDAQLRLARDDGKTIAHMGDIDAESSILTRVGMDQIEIQLPKVSEERQAARRQLAAAFRLPEFLTHLEPEEALDAFAKGGPLWLYLDNRDVVMQLPLHVRQAFVADVSLDSPRDGYEMGRDILKSETTAAPDVTVEAIGQYSDDGMTRGASM